MPVLALVRSSAVTLFCLLCLAPLAFATSYTWTSAVAGSIDDPSKWTPVGTPGAGDNLNFGVGGTFSVTYPGTVPNTNFISINLGTLTFLPTSPHTTHGFRVGSGGTATTLTQDGGVFFADYLQLGASSALTTLTLTNRAQFQSKGVSNPNGSSVGDHLGYDGSNNINIQSGSRYFSNKLDGSHGPLEIGYLSGSSCNVAVFGLATLPTVFSGLVTTGGGDMVVGAGGIGNIQAYNGGFVDASGNLLMARDSGSFGFITVGPTSIGTPFLRAQGNLWIGRNSGGAAGHAEVLIRNGAWATVAGSCEIGDPDNDAGSFLRVQDGGRFYADGGLKVWPTSGKGLDLQGGSTIVRAGQFSWPSGKFLYLSSTSGNPILKISNGITNTGPSVPAFNSQMFVARSGNGTLRLVNPGTVLSCGLGATTLADSAGGVGTVEVDSAAAFVTSGPINIAGSGSAYVTVANGSLLNVGTAAVALTNTAYAFVNVIGGAAIWAHDNVWIGGGFGGPGGQGGIQVDASEMSVYQTGGTPPLMTIYPLGSISIRYGSHLYVYGGTISNSGQFVIADGNVEAASFLQPSGGYIHGWGRITTAFGNNGKVDPHTELTNFGGIHVTGTFQQFGAGHYAVDLGTSGGKVCDTLFVSGSASLDGTLDLKTAPGFVSTPGDIFTILLCGSRTGTFSAVTWNGGPLTTQATISYQPNYVHVIIGSGVSGVDPGTGDLAGLPREVRLVSLASVRARLGFALELPAESSVQMRVFDVRGREVGTLVDGVLAAGRHEIGLPAEAALPNGTYFARAVVTRDGRTVLRTARAVLIK